MARGSSRVEAWGSSRVEALDSSRVEARGSSSVEAWGSSSVVAWGQTAIHHKSAAAPALFGQAVCFRYKDSPAPDRRSDRATIIEVEKIGGNAGWLETEGVIEADGKVILYKRVSRDWKTQENTPNETSWPIGAAMLHPAWNPTEQECGAGKFHACSRPYFCDEFRSDSDDRYIAIEVAVTDLHAWPEPYYHHKIAFRAGTVLYECDRFGDKIETAA